MRVSLIIVSLCIGLISHIKAQCPYLNAGTPNTSMDSTIPSESDYIAALDGLDIPAVFEDIYDILEVSQDCWPADTFNGQSSYGPLFIRLAWHCAGTFRSGDGAGGCGGGRQRYLPESDWDDNVNLDKARALLAPIKMKYGDALSWGDLFIFAGTASIVNMGGPVTEICAGRMDDMDGENSNVLDPGNETARLAVCPVPGNCSLPYGTEQIGLIYVNPEGFMGIPDPAMSADRIRLIFGRMGMNDSETVALIGGGHAFGKAHGACDTGPGPGVAAQPNNPWPGTCGSGDNMGKGSNTYTSGFEGQWTSSPLKWDNEFFQLLINDKFNLTMSPDNKNQWQNSDGLFMLTSDLALVYDNDYKAIVTEFANDIEKLNNAFGAVWAKLTTSGGVWANNKFCISGDELSADTSTTGSSSDTSTTANSDHAMQYVMGWSVVITMIICQVVMY